MDDGNAANVIVGVGGREDRDSAYNPNRTYKDSLFRMLFDSKEHLLSLYNALNGTDHSNVEDLEINTLENVIYMKVKNDVSFLFDSYLNLYEHQSTLNPNLPLRDLFYVSRLLQKITKDANLYSSTLVRIPTPRFVVFYNGTADAPAQKVLRLSEAFLNRTAHPELELELTLININAGKNPKLLEGCRRLKEYMIFVEKTRSYIEQMDITAAVNRAVDECIREGILADILSEQRAEVIAVCLYEYDEEKHMAAERKEHFELGLEEGLLRGRMEVYMEMGLPEEEARRRALQKGDSNGFTAGGRQCGEETDDAGFGDRRKL